MEPLEIRDRRYRLQQEIAALDAETQAEQVEALQEQVRRFQESCPHEHREENEKEGLWRCRDCDLQSELEGAATKDDEEDADAAA